MHTLFKALHHRANLWRENEYDCSAYSAIAEILDFQVNPESGTPRFLRQAQIRALEIYWYLRLAEDTPLILDLYRKLYTKKSDLIKALGVPQAAFEACDFEVDDLLDRIRQSDDFVRDFQLESLRETITLGYPSYILALAMGAGKTILIGAIMATEFAMALEYPEGPFVQNALVFAPGKTILESLRELAAMPYEQILPPRLYKPFASSVKLTFTRDGEKDIPVIRGSSFNVVVTNTEKIRIQKETIRKSDLGGLFSREREDEARSEVANLRLQSVASLPHLAVFSDEAHHTYGQSLDQELKKIRKTVDYLASKTNLICVVNTTGTPYFKRQALKDVVTWYGLSEGIRDGILKDLAGNIQTYEFDGDARAYVGHVVEDFFRDYGDISLPSGAQAKLAMYFPQTNDLRELKPTIDAALARLGLSPALCLVNTSDESLTKPADIAAFNHLNDPGAPQRVILLVNKGTEGWNCPSLFACALARKLKSSNNFVLQAATRCLRQVPGNLHRARVYLSSDNFGVLDRQLQETYGEALADLNRTGQETARTKIVLKKLDIPPLVVTRVIRTVTAKGAPAGTLTLHRPAAAGTGHLLKTSYTVSEQAATESVLRQLGETVSIKSPPDGLDAYSAAVDLAARYRLDLWPLVEELRRLYDQDDIPESDLRALAEQVERLTRAYEVKEERVDVALALVKPEGFTRETDGAGAEVFTAEIVYPKDRERLLVSMAALAKDNPQGYGFHYTPYNFDSNPELSFFEQMLARLNLGSGDVEDIYFTGALTDPAKTDFLIEYKDDKGKWRRYTPDFVIRSRAPKGGKRGSGKVLIIEIKREHDRLHPVDGERGAKALALRRWEDLNPGQLKYEMIFTPGDTVGADQVAAFAPHREE